MKALKSNILYIILIAVIIVLVFRSCGKSKELTSLQEQKQLQMDYADSLKSEYNKKTGQYEYSKQTLVAENTTLSDFLELKDKQLSDLKKQRNAKVGIITNTEIKIDTVVKNVIDTVKDTRSATIETKDYKADIISGPNKTSLSLQAWDSVKYSIGPDYRLIATHSNKYLKVTELNSFYVKPPTKKHNFKYFIGALIAGGLVYGMTR